MKRLTCFLLVLSLVFVLAGCDLDKVKEGEDVMTAYANEVIDRKEEIEGMYNEMTKIVDEVKEQRASS